MFKYKHKPDKINSTIHRDNVINIYVLVLNLYTYISVKRNSGLQ